MEHSSEEDSDISESEMLKYEDKSYKKLKSGNHSVKISDEAFTCPYCPKKRKQEYLYKDLLQHASGVGNSTSNKRSAKEKANHLALAKYLEKDLRDAGSPSKPVNEGDPLTGCSHDEKFVWPWTGIVVNIPTRRAEDGRSVGESGSKLRDELIRRGFNPTRVHPLWNFRGHSGCAVVEFHKDWPGLHNAMSFEKAYEADHYGKKDWYASNQEKSGLYAWVARSDDYNLKNIIGDHLRKIGDLKTISEMMEEEARKQNLLVSNLTNMIEVKDKHLEEMKERFTETSNSVEKLMEEKDRLLQSYNEEIKKIQLSARDHFQRIFTDHEKLKLQLESQKKELELRGEELEKRETQNENDRKILAEEIEKKADENVRKLAEDQKKQKEDLHNRIIQLEKQLDAKQALALEIERLKGSLNVMKHMGDDGDIEVLQKMETVLKDLREKEGELDDLEALNQTLIIRERKSNDELQDARKELINALKELSGRAHIGLKRMGELDNKPFLEVMNRKYNEEEAEERASELCSLWEEYLKDPDWHPFKVITAEGKHKEIINEEDEKLKGLKKEMGEEVYIAVTTALVEINEYNPSGSSPQGRHRLKEMNFFICSNGALYLETGESEIDQFAPLQRGGEFCTIVFYPLRWVELKSFSSAVKTITRTIKWVNNCEEEMKNVSQLTSLKQGIDHKNQQLFKMEHKLNEDNAMICKQSARVDMDDQRYEEELTKVSQLASLKQEIDSKNQQLSEMEQKLDDTSAVARKLVIGLMEKLMKSDRRSSEFEHMYYEYEKMYHERSATVEQLMNEKRKLKEEYIEEIRKEKSINIKLKMYQKKELEQRTKELDECKAQNDLERRRLMDEIEELKRKLQNQNPSEGASNLKAQISALTNQLKEKTEELEESQNLNNVLTVKELTTRKELHDARKESISGLLDMLNNRSTLLVKRMGEINRKAFDDMCSEKYSNGDWQEISAELCSLWERYLGDSNWHPFKRVKNGGIWQEIIDDEDEKLKELKNDHAEVYEVVTNALLELNEYNPSSRYPVPEVWNKKERRRATLKEIIQYLFSKSKRPKRKRS
ncbi:protein involved in de novo 2 [Citrus sinensis]|uniref:Protein involved in de novo 2 n=1 Tax=Citrus sinensis TaxID=2711 RepID=A0ACB8L038_CITSI|nr:protein involved in de novo 2 [Citrus sinensis]